MFHGRVYITEVHGKPFEGLVVGKGRETLSDRVPPIECAAEVMVRLF